MSGILLFISSTISLVLLVYFLNFVFLTFLSLSNHKRQPYTSLVEWPTVTVQIPIYNELFVAERVIRSVCALDYPRDKLQVIVIDDSTDETTELISRVVRDERERGVDITHLRRKGREGFKAGALQEALKMSRGEYIAVFDADFVPSKSFLKRLIPYFSADDVGLVQARWEHLNEEYSSLTRGQSLSLNLHFKIEQRAKTASGYFINFNGTAGVWRKRCIESVGGWRACLAEDLELSYRAQLSGWRLIYVDEVGCPGELPVQMQAVKRQQYRWAYGAVEVAMMHLWGIFHSRLPLMVKVQAFLQLTRHLPYPLLLFQLVVTPFLMMGDEGNLLSSLIWFLLTTLVFIYAAIVAGVRKISYLPHFLLFTTGVIVNNTYAFLKALLRRREVFLRTPKFGELLHSGSWRLSRYALPLDSLSYLELITGIYLAGTLVISVLKSSLGYAPYLALSSSSLLYTGVYSLMHGKVKPRLSPRPINMAIIGLIILAIVTSIWGFASTYYTLDRGAAYLERAMSTAVLDDMERYVLEAKRLIPGSGNPVWLFPTARTDFGLINSDIDSILRRMETLRGMDPRSDAYQQAIDDLRDRIGVIKGQLLEAAPFLFISPLSLSLSAAWLASLVVLLRLRASAGVKEK